jgi:type II secretory pathway pseudopilin PulG
MGDVMKKKNFTLIEVLFVILILIILIGISWVAGAKVIRSQNKTKMKAEVAIIESAIRQYKERYNSYPFSDTQLVNFAEKLSDVPLGAGWEGTVRPMFIDYRSNDMYTSNNNYDSNDASAATGTILLDPYEIPYQVLVVLDDSGNIIKFTVVSTSDMF